jgi:hypothetical protein
MLPRLAWIFVAELVNDILSTGFRVARAPMNQAPAEKVINIDDEWLHDDA